MTDMASSASPAGIADLQAAGGGSGRLAAAARVAMLALIGLGWLWIGLAIATNLSNPAFGLDYRWHVEAAQRLLDTGTPYLPFELSGPFVIGDGAILYPPTAFLLFIPFIWLPAVLWWAIPIADHGVRPVVASAAALGLGRHHGDLRVRQVDQCLRLRQPVDVDGRGDRGRHRLALAVRLRPRQADVRADRAARHPPSKLVDRARRARGRLPAIPGGLVRLDHGRPKLGRVAALQPADAAARPGPARGLGDRSRPTVMAAPAPAEVIATERWPARAGLRQLSPVRILTALAAGLLIAEVIVSFTVIRDAGEL